MSAYSEVADHLAGIAATTVRLTGRRVQVEAALDLAARSAIKSGEDARARSGTFASETSSEEFERVAFWASVASDILDGEIVRPSTGNVREYAIARCSHYLA